MSKRSPFEQKMTVADLRKIIANAPDDAPVVIMDHFGEPESFEAWQFAVRSVEHRYGPGYANCQYLGVCLVIDAVDIGPEPE